jgi:predicted ATP-dependent protease
MLKNEVSYEELRIKYNFDKVLDQCEDENYIFPGNTGAIEKLSRIIELGNNDNHIYISSKKGVNSEKFTKQLLMKKITKSNAYDWCYVHNFDEPYKPKALKIEKGEGNLFKDTIHQCIEKVVEKARKYFSSKEYRIAEKGAKEEFILKGEEKLDKLKCEAKELGFSTHITEKGIFFIPIIDGKKISEKEYDDLNIEVQEQIIIDLDIIETKSKSVMKEVKLLRKDAEDKVEAMYRVSIVSIIDNCFGELQKKYLNDTKTYEYIIDVKKDLLKTIESILKDLITNEDTSDISRKYKINMLNEKTEDLVPIIYSRNPSYYELFGKIEYENESGTYSTNHMLIQPGLVHEANGGYLILDVYNLISDKLIWETLKNILINREIKFENLREYYGALPIKTIKPEVIPIDIKIVLIGEENIYRLLYEYDNHFSKIFPHHIFIEDKVDMQDDNISQLCSYFNNFCSNKKYKQLSKLAKEEIIKYGIIYAGNRTKITTKTDEYEKLITLGNEYAIKDSSNVISKKNIIDAKEEINNIYLYQKEKLKKLYKNGTLLVNTKGKKVAQINGISIQDYGSYVMGCPIRITAVTYIGDNRIVNTEKDNNLSGKIFDKGISILNGYLGHLLSEKKSLGIKSSLCFEQVYGLIDGDSALCAGVYAVLSSLSKISLRQDIAITGSIDQLGNVQPVGGVSNKIEGFYNICKSKGLTGKQGVIVPLKNKDDIVLNDEILNDIKNNKFHIYVIDRIEEGVSIIMEKDFNYIKKKIKKNVTRINKEGKRKKSILKKLSS